MKKVRGNGTPHPKKTRALRDLTNQQIDGDRKGLKDRILLQEAKNSSSESPWVRLSLVHQRVAAASSKIDSMMVAAHRLGINERITHFDVDSFAAAMTEVEAILLKWDYFLRSKSHTTLQTRSCPEQDMAMENLMPMEPDGATKSMVLSNSPLVSSSNPMSSPSFLASSYYVPPEQDLQTSSATTAPFPTPLVSRKSIGSSSPFLTPDSTLPARHAWSLGSASARIRPLTSEVDCWSDHGAGSLSSLPSSPRASRLFRPSIGSTDSSISTPPSSIIPCSPVECLSPGLLTPLPPPDLLLRYPSLGNPVHVSIQEKLLHRMSSTPTFVTASGSPVSNTSAQRLSMTEYDIRKDMSGGSTCIVDDFTRSTVKRLGVKGLEEELWVRLQLGSAGAHRFVRQRPLDMPSWEGSGRKNLNDYINSESCQDQP